jgi:hypothetical protein
MRPHYVMGSVTLFLSKNGLCDTTEMAACFTREISGNHLLYAWSFQIGCSSVFWHTISHSHNHVLTNLNIS